MRLIDIEPFETAHDTEQCQITEHLCGDGYCGLRVTGTDEIPTVNAVPVVRCRECRHWRPDEDEGHCDNPDGLDNYALPTDFCSYGERKGGEG